MAKVGTSSSVDKFATTRDGDGVDVGTRDGPHASIGDRKSLASVKDGDGIGTTSEDQIGIDT